MAFTFIYSPQESPLLLPDTPSIPPQVLFNEFSYMCGASLGAQMVKNLPAMQEALVQSLGWEDLLEKGTATHPVSLPREFCGQWSLVGYSPQVAKQWTRLGA